MKIKVELVKEKTSFTFKYTPEERAILDKVMSKLSLDKSETRKLWGVESEPTMYYRNTADTLSKVCRYETACTSYVDNINAVFYRQGHFNVALFRVCGSDITVSVAEMFDVVMLRSFLDALKIAFKKITEVVVECEVEITTLVKKVDATMLVSVEEEVKSESNR